MTASPACCPIWSPAPSPLFIPPLLSPALSSPLTSALLLFPLLSSGTSFSHTLTSHLHPFSFPHLPFVCGSLTPLPPPHIKVRPRLVHSGVKFNVPCASPRSRNASALTLWTKISPFIPASSCLPQFLLISRMGLPEWFND